ncbi:9157_t:CDS:2, partial [Cetraspora pellucida]
MEQESIQHIQDSLNELKSPSEVLDDYLDSIYNLKAEVVHNLNELRLLDEQCEIITVINKPKTSILPTHLYYLPELRAICNECQDKYFACVDSDHIDENDRGPSYWRSMAEKEESKLSSLTKYLTKNNCESSTWHAKAYEDAMQKQDEKIAVADKLYNLLSRHFERLDEELARNNIHLEGLHLYKSVSKYLINSDDGDFDPNELVYCICKRPEFGQMIQCDHPSCVTGWYHWECVGLTKQPSGQWLCPDCEFIPYPTTVEPSPLDSIMHIMENFMYSYPGQGIDDLSLNNPPFHWL